jgi:hypothetical protein
LKINITVIIEKIFCILHELTNSSYFVANDMEIMKISTVFLSLGNLINASTWIYTSEKNSNDEIIQDYKKITIGEYFMIMEKTNYLFTHSHICCLIVLLFIMRDITDLSTHDYIKYAAIAYLHNIGKLGSDDFSSEIGSGLLMELWNTTFGEPFTKETWCEICRAICVNGSDSVSFESEKIKEYLYYLALANNFIDISSNFIGIRKCQNCDDIFKFKKIIFDSFNKKIYDTKRPLIIVRGVPGAGKTICANKINAFIKNKCFKTKMINGNNFKPRDFQNYDGAIILETNLSNYEILIESTVIKNKNFFVISVDVIRNIPFVGKSECSKSMVSWVPDNINKQKMKTDMNFIISHNNISEYGYNELFEILGQIY